jgi:transglutaminase-like putative cysteine protease
MQPTPAALDDIAHNDSLRRVYLDPGEYIDSDHPDIIAFAKAAAPEGAGAKEAATALFSAVRDQIRYQPYVDMSKAETFLASSVLKAGAGYCVGKAALYAAVLRVRGVPARVGFSDVRNHLTTQKLTESMGTDLFAWHGFTDVYLNGAWRKASPTFNASLCEKLGVRVLDFNGEDDALLHPFDGAGRQYMQYVRQHGSFFDVPAKFLMREMPRIYPKHGATQGRDMEAEAAAG